MLELMHAGGHDPAGARRLRRAVRREALVRVGPARFVDAEAWESASHLERHRALIDAVVPTLNPDVIVSHASAAALHGLPWVGAFPDRVVVTDVHRLTGKRGVRVQRVPGAGRVLQPDFVEGFLTTSVAATAIDLALLPDRAQGLTVLDAALRRGVERAELLEELARRPAARARTRARTLIELADAGAATAGESTARLVMHDLGLRPELQVRFSDHRGLIGYVDFWFPDEGVVVEFDGLVKYRSREILGKQSPEEAVIAEKRREDRLRAHPRVQSVARLLWTDVMPRGTAPTILAAVGLPVRRGITRVEPALGR